MTGSVTHQSCGVSDAIAKFLGLLEVPDFVGDAVTAVDERAAPEVADAIDARKRHTDEDDAKKKIIPHFHRLSLFFLS